MRGDDEQTRGGPSDDNPQAQPPWPPPPRPPLPPSQDFDEGSRGESGPAPGQLPFEGSAGSPAPQPPLDTAAQSVPPPSPPGGGWDSGPPPPPDEPRLPWEDRARHGTLPAFFRTIGLLIASPGKAFAMARKKGDYTSPISFAIIVGWFGYVAVHFWTNIMHWSVFFFFLPAELKDPLNDVSASTAGSSIIGFVVGLAFFPLVAVAGLFISAAVLHLFLMLFDGLRHSRAGFEGTLRSLAYSSVASLGYFIPFVGSLILFAWSIALQTIGAATLHDTSKGRAFAAIVVPFALCCVCIIVFAATLATILGMVFAGTGV